MFTRGIVGVVAGKVNFSRPPPATLEIACRRRQASRSLFDEGIFQILFEIYFISINIGRLLESGNLNDCYNIIFVIA